MLAMTQPATTPPPNTRAPLAHTPFATRMNGARANFLREILKTALRPGMISFAGGVPAPELFDVEGLQQATERLYNEQAKLALQYSASDGLPVLREHLAALMKSRGTEVDASQMLITTGSQQGIDLVAKVLLDAGDIVLLERPTYMAALQTMSMYEAEFRGVESDEHGLIPESLEDVLNACALEGRKAKLLYLVATFANPSGVTLPLERRQRVLEIAVKHQLLIVEDDPYSELRFSGAHVPSIMSLADAEARQWCVYMSSLSKIVSPGLRVAWLIAPDWLYPKLVMGKQSADLHTSTFAQVVAQNYLELGRLPAHLDKIRASYFERGQTMLKALEREFPKGVLHVNVPEGGMFLWGDLAAGVDTMSMVQRSIDNGVIYVPGGPFFCDSPRPNSLRLSFSTPTCEEIEEGVRRLAQVMVD
jgi:2-aminoadipate transaminase